MEDQKRKKKRGRNKIFRSCFSSYDDKHFSYDKSACRNTRNRRLRKHVLTTVSDRKGEESSQDVGRFVNGGDGVGDCYYKRCSRRRIIPRLLKSVWFDSLMVKKIRCTSKSLIRLDKIKPFLSIKTTRNLTNDSTENPFTRRSNSLCSYCQTTCSSSNSSSFSSSNNSNSRSSDQTTSSPTYFVDFRHYLSSYPQSPFAQTDPYRLVSIFTNNSNVRLCLFLLLSLVVLIVCGKIYSIVFTSTWLYFLPCRRAKRVNLVKTAAKSTETDPYQYKKKVIMAGLLDRARNPLR